MAAAILLLSCAGLSNCDRQKPDPSAADFAPRGSPKEVYEQLRKWHASHSYGSMVSWVHPDSRDELIEILIALDEMTTANTTVQVALGEYCPDVDPQPYSMAKISDFLALFAQDAEFVSETIDGDRAVVAIQVPRWVLPKELEFVQHEGRWVYMPVGIDHELARGVRDLAKGLTRFAAAIAAGARTPEQLKSEFRYRVLPKLYAFMPKTVPITSSAPQPAGASSLPS